MTTEEIQLSLIPQALFDNSAYGVSISHLNLKHRTYNSLIREGVKTIADLLKIVDSGITNIRSVGVTAKSDIELSLTALLDSISQTNTIDWFNYCKLRGIEMLPSDKNDGQLLSQTITEFPLIVKKALCHDSDDKRWRIIQRWFGLDNTEKLTLDALAEAFGSTPSRVGQLRNSALIELREAFIEGQYIGKLYRIHPDVASAIRLLFESLIIRARDFFLETELFELVQNILQVEIDGNEKSLFLLLTIAGMGRVTFGDSNLSPVWEYAETSQHDLLVNTLIQIDNLLTKDNAGPLEEFDILLSVNSRVPSSSKLTILQLRRFLELCSTVEKRNDGLFWGKFEFLKGRSNQVERILLENNRQMRMPEIVRELDRRLVAQGKDKIHPRTLLNQVCKDARFITVGKSGFWGLRSWGNIDTRSILELMERFLITLDRPATVDEIYNYIKERRPVSKNSISFYLSMKDTFKEVDRVRWGLSTWPEAQNAQVWTSEEIAEFIVGVFRAKRKKEVEHKIIKEALMEAANVNSRQALGMLNLSSVIETERKIKNGELYAKLKDDYKTQIKNKRLPFRRKSLTIFEKVDHAVRKVLESKPGKQIVLAELVLQLQNDYGFLDKTIYQYVSRLEYLEKVDIPGSNTKLCRLTDQPFFDIRKSDSYSCFISYSSKDQDFAETLHDDLENRGVECWLATEDLKIGDKYRHTIDESIKAHDKLLLVLSEHSVSSQWVEKEVETAMDREVTEGRIVLFPLRLDDSVMSVQSGWPADIRRSRHIGDFSLWQDTDSYQKSFDKLIHDLKAEEKKDTK